MTPHHTVVAGVDRAFVLDPPGMRVVEVQLGETMATARSFPLETATRQMVLAQG